MDKIKYDEMMYDIQWAELQEKLRERKETIEATTEYKFIEKRFGKM